MHLEKELPKSAVGIDSRDRLSIQLDMDGQDSVPIRKLCDLWFEMSQDRSKFLLVIVLSTSGQRNFHTEVRLGFVGKMEAAVADFALYSLHGDNSHPGLIPVTMQERLGSTCEPIGSGPDGGI